MADVKALEHPTLKVFTLSFTSTLNIIDNNNIFRCIQKVPYEILNKKFRTAQKTLDREVSHVQTAAADIEKGIVTGNIPPTDLTKLLGGMVEKLQVLKRKAEESIAEELQATNVVKKRIEHLKGHATVTSSGTVSQGALNQWRRQRLDRMIIEYFLRNGYYNAALKLADKSNINDLTNIEIFLTSREIEKNLLNHNTIKCLQWCHENRSKLRKLKSNMEFNLRVQEFVEYIRGDNRMDAIRHARKYFPSFEEEHLETIRKVMALLAFPISTGEYYSLTASKFSFVHEF